MTTNVYDYAAKQLASDSRWSFSLKDGGFLYAVVYVDNTGFEKIEYQPDYSYLFAGRSDLIDEWKKWARSPNKILIPRPPVIDDFALCIIHSETGEIKFEHGQKIVGSDHRFAGTGAHPAYYCWLKNKCSQKAVESASSVDIFSGGEVKYLSLEQKQHNLNQITSHESINEITLRKGMVMSLPVTQPVPLHEAAEKDPRVKDFTTKIANGEVSAEAPSGRDKIVWTDSDVKRLDDALSECFGIPKK
jgi:hypothetical protein